MKIATLLCLCFAPLALHAQVTAIRAGKLVNPETGSTLSNQVILVEGGKIKAVGASVEIPRSATVIDLSSFTVLPGLFDCHTHLCNVPLKLGPEAFARFPIPAFWEARGAPAFYLSTLLNPTGYRAIVGVANARAMLEAGFTTVRDVGHGGNYADTDLRRAVEEGLVPGPTILNAGKKIAPYGGQFQLQPENRALGNPEYLAGDTRDEMRKAIRENMHYGAMLIKIAVDSERYAYSADDIRFIVEEAARFGLKVSADCGTKAGTHAAAEAGVASIEHGGGMGPEEYELAKKNHVTYVPTLPPRMVTETVGFPAGWRQYAKGIVKGAFDAEVTMAFGTDVVFSKPGETHGTLAMSYIDSFVECGLPARTILQMMTANAARLLGVEKQRGALDPGQAADLIAAPENPLDNIMTLKKVTFVMKDGKVIKR